jgi:uncharacterized protein YoaH (UPF0181 family)
MKQITTTNEETTNIKNLINNGLSVFEAIEKVITACRDNQNWVINSQGTSSNPEKQGYVITFIEEKKEELDFLL